MCALHTHTNTHIVVHVHSHTRRQHIAYSTGDRKDSVCVCASTLISGNICVHSHTPGRGGRDEKLEGILSIDRITFRSSSRGSGGVADVVTAIFAWTVHNARNYTSTSTHTHKKWYAQMRTRL